VTSDGDSSEMAPARDRSAVLVLRAWVEPGQNGSFRARILSIDELGGTPTPVLTTASRAEVLQAVERWLDALVDG
jgi:hypothetical protein